MRRQKRVSRNPAKMTRRQLLDAMRKLSGPMFSEDETPPKPRTEFPKHWAYADRMAANESL